MGRLLERGVGRDVVEALGHGRTDVRLKGQLRLGVAQLGDVARHAYVARDRAIRAPPRRDADLDVMHRRGGMPPIDRADAPVDGADAPVDGAEPAMSGGDRPLHVGHGGGVQGLDHDIRYRRSDDLLPPRPMEARKAGLA